MNSSEFMLNNQVYTQKMKRKKKNQSKRKNETQQKAAQKNRELAEKQ